MADRLWAIAILAGMILGPIPWSRADDNFYPGRSESPLPGSVSRANGAPDVGSYPPQAGLRPSAPASPASFTQPPQGQLPTAPPGDQARPISRLPQPAAPPAGNGIVRLPPAGVVIPGSAATPAPSAGAPEHVDGTYREDGQYVTITINGKEMRLVKPPSLLDANIPPPQTAPVGSVRGRLMQNGRPLANCRVVMMPLQGEKKAYHFDPNREPLTTATDNEGIYFFEHVPIGLYKLTWLPDGTNQWIRRIAIKPDVIVRTSGEAVSVNTVGAARQTIN